MELRSSRSCLRTSRRGADGLIPVFIVVAATAEGGDGKTLVVRCGAPVRQHRRGLTIVSWLFAAALLLTASAAIGATLSQTTP